MQYIITVDGGKEILQEISKRLSAIPVSGNDVEHMFIARTGINQVLSSLKELKVEEKKLEE